MLRPICNNKRDRIVRPVLLILLLCLFALSFMLVSSKINDLTNCAETVRRLQHQLLTLDSVEAYWTARRNRYNKMPLSTQGLLKKIGVDRRFSAPWPRILCLTYTYADKHRNAADTSRYWAQNCTKHLIFTNADEPPIETFAEHTEVLNINEQMNGDFGYKNIWLRVRYMLEYVYESGYTTTFDFFLMGGDDQLVIMENLRKYLLSEEVWPLHLEGVPLHLGHKMTTPSNLTFLSGAGYILNGKAVELIYNHRNASICRPHVQAFSEDAFLSECLAAFGCPQRDSYDSHGEDRIVIAPLDMVVAQIHNPKYSWWYEPYHRYRGMPKPTGNNAVSVNAFLLHYMSGAHRRRAKETIYRREVD